MAGVFTISLDFELHWGGFEKWRLEAGSWMQEGGDTKLDSKSQTSNLEPPASSYERYFLNTRAVIPNMLTLFEQYGVHVTWASVGMLMHETKEQLMRNFPEVKPSYVHTELSAFDFIERVGIGANETEDPFHYAHSVVKQIIKTPNQELGSHTFGHYYCNEAGQTIEQFRADLQAAQRAASGYGVQLKSLVFPRNQFNDAYLRVCHEEGFTSVRSNPRDWFWNIETRDETAWKRLNRGLDAYLPIGKKNTYKLDSLEVRPGLPLALPASRLLRPYRPKEFFLNSFKIDRIKAEMTRAANAGEVYHLWWHPHNFGWYPEESLMGLEQILKHYNACVKRYKMTSLTMVETAEAVQTLHGKNKAA